MPDVSMKKSQIYVGKKAIPLISGEMHYWRLNPSCWRDCVRQVKAMGLSVIATYVPWGYHEYQRGKFDFTGRTDRSRNLKGFLELCKKEKVWVIIRPGPYIYSECPNDGVPDYAYKYHRLHPTFLRYAEVYMKKVCAVITPFLATHAGGNIVLLQADNEIDPWPDIFGKQYGFGKKPGMFQSFMKKLYGGDIDRLNDSWETSYESFSQVGPYEVCEVSGRGSAQRNADYFTFKHYYSARVAAWSVLTYEKNGITVPIYLNAYPFFYAHDWQQFSVISDLVGIDVYPENEFSAAPDDHRKMMDKIRYMRTFSELPYIAEFASGVWHNHHYATGVLSPNHYRLLTVSALLGGVKGWNWYMLVNRDNWYMAPINEWGRPREELTSVFSEMVSVYNAMKPYACKKCVDVAVTFTPMHYATQTVRYKENVLQQLYNADIDYECFDTRTGKMSKKILFYAGSEIVSRDDLLCVERYVKKGGIFVAFRTYPRDANGEESRHPLGLRAPDKILFKFKKGVTLSLGGGISCRVESTVCAYDSVPGTPLYGDVDGVGKMIVGYVNQAGSGTVVHLGLEPNKHMLHAIVDRFNVALPTVSQTEGVVTAYFERGAKSYVVVVNNSDESKTAAIEIRVPKFKNKKLRVVALPAKKRSVLLKQQVPLLITHLPRKDGTVFEISLAR